MFETFETAARALLVTSCRILNSVDVEYVIVGGWVPVIRGGRLDLTHPGTRDVDVLFRDLGSDAVSRAARGLLEGGFVPSAKHEFQLLQQIHVGGREFIFNVDLMHPAERIKNPELYADIFDLGAPDAHDPTGKRWLKSIVFESAEIVFSKALWSYVEVKGPDLNAQTTTVNVPLLDEAAFFLSKTKSVRQVKRPRDAFDMYYVLTGPNGKEALSIIERLCTESREITDQVEDFRNWLRSPSNLTTFNGNVVKYSRDRRDNPGHIILKCLRTLSTASRTGSK
jgi:hypothetical protein